MIYITGDCHSDFRRFSTNIFYEQKGMTKDDYVIIAGDFGGIWYQEESQYIKEENYWLNWLEAKPFTTLFVDGNHENFDRLNSYPVEKWHGGKVHKIRPSVIHLMRGEVFEIDRKKIFTFGGASSHDIDDGIIEMDDAGKWKEDARRWKKQGKMYRVRNLSWWEQELPSIEEMENGRRNLAAVNYEVDFIITHCAPQQIAAIFSDSSYKSDRLTMYLNSVLDSASFTKWFFGHYHDDRSIMGKFIMLYRQIIRIV